MKPMIQRDSLKPVAVSAGQTIVLSAKCTGEPPPAKVQTASGIISAIYLYQHFPFVHLEYKLD